LLDRLTDSRWQQAVAILLALTIAVAFYRGFSGTGAFGDEGSFCTIGQGLLAGRLPYRDYFNEKPPLQYLWTAAVMSVGGTGIAGARLASGITFFLTLALTLGQAARHPRPRRVLFPAAVILATAGVLMQAYNNTAESSLALLFVASALVLFSERFSDRVQLRGLILGLLLGLACGFRITAALAGLVLLASPWLRSARMSFAAGFIAGLAIWLCWLASAGIFGEAMAAVLFFHWGNAGAGSYFRGPDRAAYPALAAWLLILAAGWAGSREHGFNHWLLLLAITAAVPFFGRMDAFRLWPSTALVLTTIWNARGARSGALGWALALSMLGLGWLGFNSPYSFSPVQRIVAGVERYSTPAERIWVAPFSPNVYCLSGRSPASRYYFVLPWIAKPDMQAELMRDLRARPPALIVELLHSGYSLDALVPDAWCWMQRNYRLVETRETVRFWRLESTAAAP
jgi:hypothetical protein